MDRMSLITKLLIAKVSVFAEAGPERDRVVGVSRGTPGDGQIQRGPHKKSEAPESDFTAFQHKYVSSARWSLSCACLSYPRVPEYSQY